MSQRIDIWVESAGLGHVTRQINLVEHLRDRPDLAGVQYRFLVDEKPATHDTLKRATLDFVVRNSDEDDAFRQLDKDWTQSAPAVFILDSVNHDANANAHLVLADDQVFSVVVVDDPSDRDVDCDLLVNALPTLAKPRESSKAVKTLRGVEYLILPKEFAIFREDKARRDIGECDNGFAFFGGADLENFTRVFLEAIENGSPVKQWTLLLGPTYEHVSEAERRVRDGGLPVKVVRYVDSMAVVLAAADVAVLAAGNTLSEAAAVGTPTIALSQNPVQAANAKFFAERTGVVDLGGLADESVSRLNAAIGQISEETDRRRTMSDAMMATVDGLGGRRIAELLAAELKARK